MIAFSDLVDLWVIKINKPMILCARSMSRSSEQSTKHRSHSENMQKVCLFYSQNNKMLWLSNMADTFVEKFTRCAKACGLFLPGSDWLGRQALITWLPSLSNLRHMWRLVRMTRRCQPPTIMKKKIARSWAHNKELERNRYTFKLPDQKKCQTRFSLGQMSPGAEADGF